MVQPRFRFLDGASAAAADAQFWRDVEASERLGSPFKANLFLRELCRAKASADGPAAADPETRAAAESTLLRAVFVRGYRLFGADLELADDAPRASVG